MRRIVQIGFEPRVVDRLDRLCVYTELSQLGYDESSVSGLLLLCILLASLSFCLIIRARVAIADIILCCQVILDNDNNFVAEISERYVLTTAFLLASPLLAYSPTEQPLTEDFAHDLGKSKLTVGAAVVFQ
jgi:hypothetical protein